jgi:hypothetical protein
MNRYFQHFNINKLLWVKSVALRRTLLPVGVVLLAQPIYAQTLPPSADIPEEVLQIEIITEARSPVDGRPLTAAEYAELQAQLQIAAEDVPGRIAPKLQKTISLLRLRKLLKTFLPFLIK